MYVWNILWPFESYCAVVTGSSDATLGQETGSRSTLESTLFRSRFKQRGACYRGVTEAQFVNQYAEDVYPGRHSTAHQKTVVHEFVTLRINVKFQYIFICQYNINNFYLSELWNNSTILILIILLNA